MGLATVRTSIVVAALVSDFISLHNSERAIKVEHIMKERTTCRDKVRGNVFFVHQASVARGDGRLKEMYLEFRLLLNPVDSGDRVIFETIKNLMVYLEIFNSSATRSTE